MNGRLFKIFLPIFLGIFTLFFLYVSPSKVSADDSNGEEYGTNGSITVCKIILDENGNIVDGSTRPGTLFSISGIIPAETSEAAPVGQIGTSNFTSPLSLSADVIPGGGNDSQCTTFSGLTIGSYYYGQESITPAIGWATPKYNDQFTTAVNSLNDFFNYDPNLFDGNPANDSSRNKNVDGHIVLRDDRPNRALIVLNQMTSLPVGGGGPSVGGNITTPQCPTDRPQQVDQVWFTNIQPNEVTVNWANKGDAWGFQIAYGPSQNDLIWGVEVNDPNATQYTLKDLPGGEIWVSVIAKSSKECGGPSSPVVKASVEAPQVLGATGVETQALMYFAGFGLISTGLWQALKGLKKGSKKA